MGDTQVEVCVVGGGLGGLAFAIALQELGLNYVVCESAEELRTGALRAGITQATAFPVWGTRDL